MKESSRSKSSKKKIFLLRKCSPINNHGVIYLSVVHTKVDNKAQQSTLCLVTNLHWKSSGAPVLLKFLKHHVHKK